jgi:hypothetical protein
MEFATAIGERAVLRHVADREPGPPGLDPPPGLRPFSLDLSTRPAAMSPSSVGSSDSGSMWPTSSVLCSNSNGSRLPDSLQATICCRMPSRRIVSPSRSVSQASNLASSVSVTVVSAASVLCCTQQYPRLRDPEGLETVAGELADLAADHGNPSIETDPVFAPVSEARVGAPRYDGAPP